MWKKWQLFHATDFQSLMCPCFTFCSVLGLFPYRINSSIFETSKLRYILSTIIICIFCIHELVALYMINVSGTIKFERLPKTLQYDCFYIVGSIIAVVTYILSGPRMRLLQTIMNISSKLPHNSYQKMSKLIHTKDILGFFFLLILAIVYYCAFKSFHDWYKIFSPYIILLIFQMDMLYMNCVCILKACFKRIDNNLINLRELVINDEPHLLRRTYHKHKNSFLLTELKALKKHHLAVSDTVQMLNTVFSQQLLATIIVTFSTLTFYLYFYIVHWKTGVEPMAMNHAGDLIYDIFSIISIIYYSLKMMMIVWACETGKDQAIKIGITIHDLLNNSSDKQINDELKLFSLQVLHRENIFSAKGLAIDATLLVAIVCNITTYLLILIQFLVADEVCKEKSESNVTLTM